MAGIELELSVVDKGSAEIANVARKAMTAFDQIRSHAVSAGSTILSVFKGLMSPLTSFLGTLFSIRVIMLLLAGGGVVALFSRAMTALAEHSEPRRLQR